MASCFKSRFSLDFGSRHAHHPFCSEFPKKTAIGHNIKEAQKILERHRREAALGKSTAASATPGAAIAATAQKGRSS